MITSYTNLIWTILYRGRDLIAIQVNFEHLDLLSYKLNCADFSNVAL